MILPDSRNYGQSFVLYVLANTDLALTASAIASLNEDARASSTIRRARKDLYDQGYLMRRKTKVFHGNGKRPYEYRIKPVDVDQYFDFEVTEWEQTHE